MNPYPVSNSVPWFGCFRNIRSRAKKTHPTGDLLQSKVNVRFCVLSLFLMFDEAVSLHLLVHTRNIFGP
jgi:hypothetical protein